MDAAMRWCRKAADQLRDFPSTGLWIAYRRWETDPDGPRLHSVRRIRGIERR